MWTLFSNSKSQENLENGYVLLNTHIDTLLGMSLSVMLKRHVGSPTSYIEMTPSNWMGSFYKARLVDRECYFCTLIQSYIKSRDYPGLLRQSLKFREIASSHSEKCSFQAHIISFYVWDHISEGKACIKNPKTCGPSKWPPLTNSMSYSYGRSVSIEKPR